MMPRGQHPNSRKNLEVNHSSEKARINGKKGGEQKGINYEEYRTFQQIDKDVITNADRTEMLKNLAERAKTDNKAWELYATYMGMKPSDKLEVAAVDPEAENRLAEAIRKRRADAEKSDS